LADASKAIELDKTYVKGFYRRAAAHMSLGKFKEALKDYEYVSCHVSSRIFSVMICAQVTKVRPNDKDAKTKYTECNKIVKKIAFEKAISVEDTKKNIASTINLDAMSKLFRRAGPKAKTFCL
jgi:serine/threonine-protein phosphatase 5